jgi:hypothetical protein
MPGTDRGLDAFVLRILLGTPGSYMRYSTVPTVTFLFSIPLFYLVSLLRHHFVIALLVVLVPFLIIYELVDRLIERLYQRRKRRFAEKHHEEFDESRSWGYYLD